jgi:Flp pilus assembly protein TadG
MRGTALRRRPHGEGGAAAVEFALISILLFLLIFGGITFGLAWFQRQAAAHAAREGARLAAVGVADCTTWRTTVKDRGKGGNIGTPTLTYQTPAGAATTDPKAGDVAVVKIPQTISMLPVAAFIPGMTTTLNVVQQDESRVERVIAATKAGCP